MRNDGREVQRCCGQFVKTIASFGVALDDGLAFHHLNLFHLFHLDQVLFIRLNGTTCFESGKNNSPENGGRALVRLEQ